MICAILWALAIPVGVFLFLKVTLVYLYDICAVYCDKTLGSQVLPFIWRQFTESTTGGIQCCCFKQDPPESRQKGCLHGCHQQDSAARHCNWYSICCPVRCSVCSSTMKGILHAYDCFHYIIIHKMYLILSIAS